MKTLDRTEGERDEQEVERNIRLYRTRYQTLSYMYPGLDDLYDFPGSIFSPELDETDKPKGLCRFIHCRRPRSAAFRFLYSCKGPGHKTYRRRERRWVHNSIWCGAHEKQMQRKGFLSPIDEAKSEANLRGAATRRKNAQLQVQGDNGGERGEAR